MVLVLVTLLPAVESATLDNRKDTRPVAMALSMIVEITSETPRVTLSQPAMPAHNPPVTTAISNATMMLSQPGSQPWPAKTADAKAATRYCPSTPMLNRFIRKPIATATADR